MNDKPDQSTGPGTPTWNAATRSFPALTYEQVCCERALWLITVSSEDDYIHTHVPLFMDCVVVLQAYDTVI